MAAGGLRSRSRIAAVLSISIVATCVSVTASGNTSTSGLRGVVTRAPIVPVCVVRGRTPCSGPAAGVTLVFSQQGSVLGRARAATDGTYRVGLAPGTYAVRAVHARPLTPATVTVMRGRYKRVDFSIDTGIR